MKLSEQDLIAISLLIEGAASASLRYKESDGADVARSRAALVKEIDDVRQALSPRDQPVVLSGPKLVS